MRYLYFAMATLTIWVFAIVMSEVGVVTALWLVVLLAAVASLAIGIARLANMSNGGPRKSAPASPVVPPLRIDNRNYSTVVIHDNVEVLVPIK